MGFLVQVTAVRADTGDTVVATINMADAPDSATASSNALAAAYAKAIRITGSPPTSISTTVLRET